MTLLRNVFGGLAVAAGRLLAARACAAFALGGEHVALLRGVARGGIARFLLDVVVLDVVFHSLVVLARRGVVAFAILAARAARRFLLPAARTRRARLLLLRAALLTRLWRFHRQVLSWSLGAGWLSRCGALGASPVRSPDCCGSVWPDFCEASGATLEWSLGWPGSGMLCDSSPLLNSFDPSAVDLVCGVSVSGLLGSIGVVSVPSGAVGGAGGVPIRLPAVPAAASFTGAMADDVSRRLSHAPSASAASATRISSF